MDCAPDDDRTIVIAMVDFAITDQCGLIFSKILLAIKPIFSFRFDRWTFKL